MENGNPKKYDSKDLSFKDYPQMPIMHMAVWLQRKEFLNKYPGCKIEIVNNNGFIRISAYEAEEKESSV